MSVVGGGELWIGCVEEAEGERGRGGKRQGKKGEVENGNEGCMYVIWNTGRWEKGVASRHDGRGERLRDEKGFSFKGHGMAWHLDIGIVDSMLAFYRPLPNTRFILAQSLQGKPAGYAHISWNTQRSQIGGRDAEKKKPHGHVPPYSRGGRTVSSQLPVYFGFRQ